MSFTVAVKARSSPQADLIFDWLADNIDAGMYCYNGMDRLTRDLSFSFDREQDYLMFVLRWS